MWRQFWAERPRRTLVSRWEQRVREQERETELLVQRPRWAQKRVLVERRQELRNGRLWRTLVVQLP